LGSNERRRVQTRDEQGKLGAMNGPQFLGNPIPSCQRISNEGALQPALGALYF
jgi:hypothetical protein